MPESPEVEAAMPEEERPDQFETPDTVEIRMRDKCATCAFRPGTGPNRSKVTLIKAKLCADTAIPFLCHEADREAMCAGFADLIERQYAKGELANGPDWKKEISLGILDIIDKFEDADREGRPLPDFREEMMAMLERTK